MFSLPEDKTRKLGRKPQANGRGHTPAIIMDPEAEAMVTSHKLRPPSAAKSRSRMADAIAEQDSEAKTTGRKVVVKEKIGASIKPLRLGMVAFRIQSITPMMQARFSSKARGKMAAQMAEGQASRSRKVRDPRDFAADAAGARHSFANDPEASGIPAAAFRAAMISACRTVGYKMTLAKLALFVQDDGVSDEGTALVRIEGNWDINVSPVRNSNGGTDLRARPFFREWSAVVRVEFDQDLLSPDDILNLMSRAGLQVGIGEGRPDSRMSAGLGLGRFKVVGTTT